MSMALGVKPNDPDNIHSPCTQVFPFGHVPQSTLYPQLESMDPHEMLYSSQVRAWTHVLHILSSQNFSPQQYPHVMLPPHPSSSTPHSFPELMQVILFLQQHSPMLLHISPKPLHSPHWMMPPHPSVAFPHSLSSHFVLGVQTHLLSLHFSVDLQLLQVIFFPHELVNVPHSSPAAAHVVQLSFDFTYIGSSESGPVKQRQVQKYLQVLSSHTPCPHPKRHAVALLNYKSKNEF